jgi:non-canonical purine NTP pyrophosphatase (RdgB/HAM1 family)
VSSRSSRLPPDPDDLVLDRPRLLERFGRPRQGELVFTNGVFDLLHRGHAQYLAAARRLGDRLVVGVNSDESVARLKGPVRPFQPAGDRAYLLASLACVDAVTVFGEDTPRDLIEELLPDVLVKGADYAEDQVVGASTVREAGGRVELIPLVEGRSTSRLVERIRRRTPEPGGPTLLGNGSIPAQPELPEGRILVATRSPHKMEEIRELLDGTGLDPVSLAEIGVEERSEEERIEVHETFAANALAKARYFHDRTGMFTLADDSGLCVDALVGAPGVRTKRFAPGSLVQDFGRDEANNRHLLRVMTEIPEGERGAHYRCAAAAYDGRGHRIWEGRVEGRIAREPRGTGGFGYDPLFVIPDRERTFAELPAEVKARISHRARAFRAFRQWVDAGGEGTG